MTIDLTARRIRWSLATTSEIEAIRRDAAMHGDTVLAARATRALARR